MIALHLNESEAWVLLRSMSSGGDAEVTLSKLKYRIEDAIRGECGQLLAEKTAEIGSNFITGKGYVYFATTASGKQALDAGESAPVKVGKASNLARRMSELQTGCPEAMLFYHLLPTENSDADEKALHRHFAAQRLHHEWFRLSQQDILNTTSGNVVMVGNVGTLGNVGKVAKDAKDAKDSDWNLGNLEGGTHD